MPDFSAAYFNSSNAQGAAFAKSGWTLREDEQNGPLLMPFTYNHNASNQISVALESDNAS